MHENLTAGQGPKLDAPHLRDRLELRLEASKCAPEEGGVARLKDIWGELLFLS